MDHNKQALRLILVQEAPRRKGKWWNCPLEVGFEMIDGLDYIRVQAGETKVILNGPEAASLAEALRILSDHATVHPLKAAINEAPPQLVPEHPISDLKIPAHSLAMRVINKLKPTTVEELLEHTPEDLIQSGGIGEKTLAALCGLIRASGLQVPPEWRMYILITEADTIQE